MIPLPSLNPWEVTRPRWPPGTQSKTSKAQQSMDLVQHWRPRPMVQWWLCRHAYLPLNIWPITKCTLLRLDSCNFIKLSETYLKRTDRDVVFYYIICVFTIIFPSANQLHCISLTMISKNTEYNFPPNSKGTFFFPYKSRDLYISITYVGWDQRSSNYHQVSWPVWSSSSWPSLSGLWTWGAVDIKSPQKSFKARLVGRQMVVFECIFKIWV